MKTEYIRAIVRCLMEATEEQLKAILAFVRNYIK